MNKPHEHKTTVEMQAPPDWAIRLSEKVEQGFLRVEANIGVVNSEMQTLAARVGVMEGRMIAVEARQSTTSERVKQTSQADLGHDAAIAEIRTTVAELKARPDTAKQVLEAVEKLAERPLVKKVGGALVPVLMIAISLIGLKLQAQVAKLEAAPPPPPVVAIVDGGAP